VIEAGSIIRPAVHSDVGALVRVHLRCFPESTLTTLGPKFLTLYYDSLVGSPVAAVRVAELAGDPAGLRLTGFVGGCSAPGEFHRSLLRRYGIRMFWAALPSLLRGRVSLAPIAAGILDRLKPSPEVHEGAELASVAVDPDFQGRGIGGRLVGAFVEAMDQSGVRSVILGTRDAATVRLYERYGFVVIQQRSEKNGGVAYLMRRSKESETALPKPRPEAGPSCR
jgi:ribosomal protein S18 acetylase RimI-like enzyme